MDQSDYTQRVSSNGKRPPPAKVYTPISLNPKYDRSLLTMMKYEPLVSDGEEGEQKKFLVVGSRSSLEKSVIFTVYTWDLASVCEIAKSIGITVHSIIAIPD